MCDELTVRSSIFDKNSSRSSSVSILSMKVGGSKNHQRTPMIARTRRLWNTHNPRKLAEAGKFTKYNFRVVTWERGASLVGESYERGTYGSSAGDTG